MRKSKTTATLRPDEVRRKLGLPEYAIVEWDVFAEKWVVFPGTMLEISGPLSFEERMIVDDALCSQIRRNVLRTLL